MRKNNHYGYIPDLPDYRDRHYMIPQALRTIPPKMDLRDSCPAIYNQGSLGSCTANALCGAYEYLLKKEGKADFMPSRLFLYYNERVYLGTETNDSGAMIRDGIKSLAKDGICLEANWPYVIGNFAHKPTEDDYSDALSNKILSYERAPQSLLVLKSILVQGLPFVFGISVYENFENSEAATTGRIGMPEGHMLGGHAIMAVGYDDVAGVFICRNSWGTAWGDGGYFYLPYLYVGSEDLAADFWVIKIV